MENKFYVYMLRCSDGTYYVGHTDNFQRRLAEHNNGKYEGYTSLRRPLMPVFLQDFATRKEAKTAELKIKRWGSKKKEALISNNWQIITALGKKNFDRADRNSPSASSDCKAIVSRGADGKTKF